jgi:hypothetical protein
MAQSENGKLKAAEGKIKAPYKSPRLVVYGNARELTAGVTGSHPDPGQNNNTKRGV